MRKSTTSPARSEFPPRVWFNWGYHDGASAAAAGRFPEWTRGTHFSRAYEAGYWAGYDDAAHGAYISGRTLSDCAWTRATGLPTDHEGPVPASAFAAI